MPQVPLLRLAFDMQSAATETQVEEHFRATVSRGYEPLNKLLGVAKDGVCSLVGAGPSLKETLSELTGDVIAINSAIHYLLDNGVVPKYAMLWDAWQIVEKFAVPHPDVTYLVASRCHPDVFKRLEGCKVVVWHAAGDHHILDLVKEEASEPYPVMVNGGTAGITRGIYLADALGYKSIHLFGADSSYAGDATHVRGSVVAEKDTMVAIGCAPPLFFRTTPEWCQQVNEYKTIYTLFTRCGFKFATHGMGMLQTMHEILEAKKKLKGEEQFFAEMLKEHNEQLDMDMAASRGDVDVPLVEPPKKRPPSYEVT